MFNRGVKRMKDANFPEAVAMLVGTTIGAGILGIPYAVAQTGLMFGILSILLLGAIVLLINLYVGEIALRTKNDHMLAGYAGKYLGKWAKTLMAITAIFGIYGALTAYIIGEGEVLSSIFGGSSFMFSMLFFAIFAGLMFFRLNIVAESELIMSVIMLALISILMIFGLFHMDDGNFGKVTIKNFFFSYGVIFFALIGASAIPEMKAELKANPKRLKKAILIGSIIPILVYVLFTIVTIKITGINTTEIATIGLGEVVGKNMLLLGNAFAVFSMATSFLLLGFAMKWMLHYDYGISRLNSWFLTLAVPLLIYLFFTKDFIKVVGFTGAVAGGIEGMLIVLTAMKAKHKGERKPEYSIPINNTLAGFLILIFALGIVYQFLF